MIGATDLLLLRRKGDVSGKSRRNKGIKTGLTWLPATENDGCNSMPSRRLEDRIRDLCREALTSSGSNFDSVLEDLRASLHEHSERLRQIMALRLATKTHAQVPDRRAHEDRI